MPLLSFSYIFKLNISILKLLHKHYSLLEQACIILNMHILAYTNPSSSCMFCTEHAVACWSTTRHTHVRHTTLLSHMSLGDMKKPEVWEQRRKPQKEYASGTQHTQQVWNSWLYLHPLTLSYKKRRTPYISNTLTTFSMCVNCMYRLISL